jgi:predicted kinase
MRSKIANTIARSSTSCGPPAAGKSTIAGPIGRQLGAVVIDADRIKTVLPGYDGGAGASIVHKESVMLADRVMVKAMINGDNMVLESMGYSLVKVREELAELHQAGYQIHVTLVHAEPPALADRMVERYKRTGCGVAIDMILNDGWEPLKTWDKLAQEGVDGVTGFRAFDSTTFPLQEVEAIGADLDGAPPRLEGHPAGVEAGAGVAKAPETPPAPGLIVTPEMVERDQDSRIASMRWAVAELKRMRAS